jgi:hypothetical protein
MKEGALFLQNQIKKLKLKNRNQINFP